MKGLSNSKDDYIERFDQFCIANDITDTDTIEKKKALLLSVIGSHAYSVLKALLAPSKPSSKKYNEICELMKQHVSPKPIVIAERYRFYHRKQKSGESVTQFLTELRKLSETCSFQDFLEEVLRDMFVIGLNDRTAQKKLLGESNLSIKSAYEIALSFELANQHMNTMHGQDEVVRKVDRPACFRCGRKSHAPDDCLHRNTKCYGCGCIGHIVSKCPERRYKVKKNDDKDSERSSSKPHKYGKKSYDKNKKSSKVKNVFDDENSDTVTDTEDESEIKVMTLSHLRKVHNKSPEIILNLKLNKKEVSMELDTGASVSLIPKLLKDKLLPDVKIKPSDILLRTVTGEKVRVTGKCKVDVTYKNQTVPKLILYVIDAKGPALFGRNWLSHINLDWRSICNVKTLETKSNSELKDIIHKYRHIFKGDLGKIKNAQAKLLIKPDAVPKFFKPRPVPFAMKDGIAKELARLEETGIIEKIDYSDWAAPIVPVPKPNGDIRICGDYKVTINQVLKVPEHPMPRAEELFQTLNGGEKFSKLDLSSAYQQVELSEDSKKYVAINTHVGLFTYTRMPFGISSAPAIFQATMDKILHGLNVGCYLDDIIVTGKNDIEHLQNLERVLTRLKEANVSLRYEKCEFMVPSVTYLGFIITKEGINMDSRGTEAVRCAPRPKNRAELQSFLGLVNHYRKHIPNMSSLCNPLNLLLCKDQKWKWTTKTEEAFNVLKSKLTAKDTMLIHYDPTKEVTLAVDASPVGLGAVLSQNTDKGEQPVAYASRSLSKSEKNYAQLEKEGLAIIFGIKRFHQYLYGRKFILVTDNKPLSLILGEKKGIPVLAAARIQRWAIELSAYDYELKHKPANRNCHADALSRLPLGNVEQPTGVINWTHEATMINREQVSHLPITAKAISKEIRRDPILSKVLFLTQNGWPERMDLSKELQSYFNRRLELSVEEGCLLLGTRTIIPQKWQHLILQELHSNHLGIVRMKALARMHVWWPTIDKDIEKVVRHCQICQELQPKAPQAEANPWKWPTQPWHRIHIDFANYKNENFLIIVDAHSKWPEVHHMKSTTTEKTMEVLRRVFAQHGVPLELVSDNGPQFTSDDFEKFLKLNDIKHLKSPAFHPSTNGEAERFVQTFKKGMKARKNLKCSWNMKISDFLLSYRTTPHSVTRRTPAELLVGRNLRTRLDAVHPNIGMRIEQQTSPKNLVELLKLENQYWCEIIVREKKHGVVEL